MTPVNVNTPRIEYYLKDTQHLIGSVMPTKWLTIKNKTQVFRLLCQLM